mgnify:CR=1
LILIINVSILYDSYTIGGQSITLRDISSHSCMRADHIDLRDGSLDF